MNHQLPVEITEFEPLLRKPECGPAGFAGFFNSGEAWVPRAPKSQRQRLGCFAPAMTGARRFDFGVPEDFATRVPAVPHWP